MKNLIIIGAGGFGREVFVWAQQSLDFKEEWYFKGFLDDNPQALKGFDYPRSIIAPVEDYNPEPNDRFLCALGDPRLKKSLVLKILRKGGQFATLVHSSAIIGRNVKLGQGVILCPRVVLTCDITIGNFVSLNCATAVGHDVVVGDWCQLSSFCDLTGQTSLGESVFMGSHATVLPGTRVDDNATVGAGSVVLRPVAAGTTVFGTAAKPLKF